jgi:hypothetical protein
MIDFSLLLTQDSTISVEYLRQTALPAVVGELDECGYAVDQDDTAAAADEHGLVHQYRIAPRPASMRVTSSDIGQGGMQFRLTGDKFGRATGAGEKDPVLWMRLVVLGFRLSQAYTLVSDVSDPDFPTTLPSPGAQSSPT